MVKVEKDFLYPQSTNSRFFITLSGRELGILLDVESELITDQIKKAIEDLIALKQMNNTK